MLAGDADREGTSRLRITPTSNFILQRSPNVEVLEPRTGFKAWQIAPQYSPFHWAVIGQPRCAVIVTHAIVIARQMALIFGLGEDSQRDSGWGRTISKCYAWRLPDGPMFLAIPNLSRYTPDRPRQVALTASFDEFVPVRELSCHHVAQTLVSPASSRPPPRFVVGIYCCLRRQPKATNQAHLLDSLRVRVLAWLRFNKLEHW